MSAIVKEVAASWNKPLIIPVRARVLRAGAWQDVPFTDLRAGDVVSHLEFQGEPAVMYRVEFEGERL